MNLNLKNFFKNFYLKGSMIKLTLFIISVFSLKITDKYKIEIDPILKFEHSNIKFHIGTEIDTSRKVLVKIYGSDCNVVDVVHLEFCIHSQLEHEVIPKFKEYYCINTENPNMQMVAFIYEYHGETTLKEYITTKIQNGNFRIYEAITILRSILIGIQHFNKNFLYLINLSVENILVNEKSEIRFIDYEFFNVYNYKVGYGFYNKDVSLFDRSIAPEISEKSMGREEKCDLYSFGIIMNEIYENIDFGDDYKLKLELECKYFDLMMKCLEMKTEKRININDALEHPMFQLILPHLYEFTKLKAFEIHESDYSVILKDNLVFYKDIRNFILIKQKHHIIGGTTTLLSLGAEYFEFSINGKMLPLSEISNREVEFVKIIFECIVKKALQSKPQFKIGLKSDESLILQKKYLQNVALKPIKTHINSISQTAITHTETQTESPLDLESQMPLNPQSPQDLSNESTATPGKNLETSPSNNPNNKENTGITWKRGSIVLASAGFVGAFISFCVSKYFGKI